MLWRKSSKSGTERIEGRRLIFLFWGALLQLTVCIYFVTNYFAFDLYDKDQDALSFRPPMNHGALHMKEAWKPRSYSEPYSFERNVARGLNIINARSGCNMAAWVYDTGTLSKTIHRNDCGKQPSSKKLHQASQAANILTNDTLYVLLLEMDNFVENFLPYIINDFVLITGQWQQTLDLNTTAAGAKIVNNEHVLSWFGKDITKYTGGNQYHPKVHQFPIGLKPRKYGSAAAKRSYLNPLPLFQKKVLQYAYNTKKNNTIFASFIRQTISSRSVIPSGKELTYENYLEEIAKAKYVISPDGMHPDCHRHYEALGLGSVPITELDPVLHRHLKEGPVIYNNTVWNMSRLEAILPKDLHLSVNRNLVFEEYWMEYVERTVGRPLRWWDYHQVKQCLLSEFSPSSG